LLALLLLTLVLVLAPVLRFLEAGAYSGVFFSLGLFWDLRTREEKGQG
jgi:hypothetical protein